MSKLMQFKADVPNKQILIEREFDADIQDVWNAYTKSELLDQWWAPYPFKNKTRSMNFAEGGMWHYCMISPDNQVHWALLKYLKISPQVSFEAKDSFCDENANLNTSFPSMHWSNMFIRENRQTKLSIVITAEQSEHIEQYIQIGFKEGFESGLNQLEQLLKNK